MKAVEIKEEVNYWLIRPGVNGKYYDHFYQDSCVAIGWDRIGNIDEEEKITSLEELKFLVERKYHDLLDKKRTEKEYRRKISDIATKIYRFTYEVKIGDIIITPGESSVLIGRIIGDVQIESGKYIVDAENREEEYIGELNKTRKVVWLKKIERSQLEPNIKLELRVIHGISKISNEQVITEINRTLYSFYKYNSEGHSIYKIKSNDSIDFEKYAKFISCIYDIYSRVKSGNENLYIKANINSPGPIELFGDYMVIEKITTIMHFIFKPSNVHSQQAMEDQEVIEDLKQKYEGLDYNDYEFPSGGQA